MGTEGHVFIGRRSASCQWVYLFVASLTQTLLCQTSFGYQRTFLLS
jgi:hypothetical protein